MELKNTPLHGEHRNLGASMGPFAGWEMPIHYGSILDESRHTRSAVSIFDTSHMGEIIIREDPVNSSLDRGITIPVLKMKNNRCKYGFLLNDRGMILDDLVAYRKSDNEWMLVVNASNVQKDFDALKSRLSPGVEIENISPRTVKIDVQGPRALDVMKALAGDEIKKLTYYTFGYFNLLGGTCLISRTGYTGELGFEIYIDSAKGPELWQTLLKNPAVRPAGLGARDILRLEMGLPLYGSDLTEETTPLDGGMDRFLDMDKDFLGKPALVDQRKKGVPRTLAAFSVADRRSPRHGNRILAGGAEAGIVTSGVFSPHLNRGIGMGYIDIGSAAVGTALSIDTGRAALAAVVEQLPFIKQTSVKFSEV